MLSESRNSVPMRLHWPPGAQWRNDGVGRSIRFSVPGCKALTPDDIMDGKRPDTPGSAVTVYDDDHYYMASVIAETACQ